MMRIINIRIILNTMLIIIFIAIINSTDLHSENIGYVYSGNGDVFEMDFDSLVILRQSKLYSLNVVGEKIYYDKNQKKTYIYPGYTDGCVIMNMIDFKIEKTIESSSPYLFHDNIPFVNAVKDNIYIEAREYIKSGDSTIQEPRMIVYNTNEYSYSLIDNKYFRYYQFTSEGEYLYRIWDDSDIKKIEKRSTSNFELVNTYYLPQSPKIDTIKSFILSPDNKRLYINAYSFNNWEGNHEIILDVENWSLIKDLIIEELTVILSNDGKYLYNTKIDSSYVIVKKTNTENFISEDITVGKLSDNIGYNLISLSPDNSILLIGSIQDEKNPSGSVIILDLNTKTIKGRINIEYYPIAVYFK